MNEFIKIKGYGIPFMKPAMVADGLEMIDPSAFDAMLAKPDGNISVLWRSHDDAPELATTALRSLKLFVDDYGLGFCATVKVAAAPMGFAHE